MVHVEVLAPHFPVQLVLAPLVTTVEVGLQGQLGEGLKGSENHGEVDIAWHFVAVHKVVVGAGGLPQVVADPPGEHHGIRVRLDGPIVALPATLILERLPKMHEEQGVGSCVVLGLPHRSLLEPDRVDLRTVFWLAQVGPLILAKDSVLVTVEDTGLPTNLLLHEAKLIGCRHHDLEAEKRRVAPSRGGGRRRRDRARCGGRRGCGACLGRCGVGDAGADSLAASDNPVAAVVLVGSHEELPVEKVAALRPLHRPVVDCQGGVKVAERERCGATDQWAVNGLEACIHAGARDYLLIGDFALLQQHCALV
mmetsp:Transcript_30761/g.71499  ORF Transcript_30761/g.71499 Transcript_30761/m.71499 type:complete len:309 (+) Transcript_30761:274-1200(+)